MSDANILVIHAHFTDSNFKGCTPQINEMLKPAGKDVANPMIGLYVFRPRGAAFWIAQDLCQYLVRSGVPFVRVECSIPLSGSLKEAGQQALRNIGVEFWNKDE